MSKRPVVVYGASGYTGRLVCESLRNYGLPFVAAGRDKARLESAMRLVPGIETAEYEVVAVEHRTEALSELFHGAEIVCNTVGPFLYYGETVVEAAARAGVHYIDTTGELEFMESSRSKFGPSFREAGKVLAPCTAYMYTPLEIAARIVLETEGIDTLEAACSATGTPTYASTQTIFAMFQSAATAFYLAENRRVVWPAAKGYEVVVPGLPMTQLAHPWGGGSLPLYFERDPRVKNCRQLTAFTNRELMEQVVVLQATYERDLKQLPKDEQAAQLGAIAERIQPGMPPRENALVHRNTDHVSGRGGNVTAQCTIRSFNPYQITGLVQAATAYYLVGGHQRASGFCSACDAVGHRELLGQLRSFGFAELISG
jgi:uncharacterized protein YbjT (DUF2867 family)